MEKLNNDELNELKIQALELSLTCCKSITILKIISEIKESREKVHDWKSFKSYLERVNLEADPSFDRTFAERVYFEN